MITSFANLWEGVARVAGDRAAVVMGDRALSWTEFGAAASRVARGLAGVGVTRGTPVAVMARNSPEYAVALFAAMKLGATPVNVNFRYTAAELVYLLDDCAAWALVCDADLLDVALAARGLAKNRVVTIAIGIGADDSAEAIPFELLGADVEATESETSGDDVVLLYTGGTTGTPKGVIWSHRSLFETITFNAYTAFGLSVPATDAEVVAVAEQAIEAKISPMSLLASPLTHATALFMAISTWLLGGTVVFLAGRRYDPDELAAVIQRQRVSQLVIVGDVFGRPLADALDAARERGEPYDLSSLRLVASAGVVWSSSTKQRLAAHGSMTLIDVLGASEGGPYALSVVPPRSRARLDPLHARRARRRAHR